MSELDIELLLSLAVPAQPATLQLARGAAVSEIACPAMYLPASQPDELAGLAAQSAEAARWAPASLSWKEPEAELVEVDDQDAGDDDASPDRADSDVDDVSAINDEGHGGEADADYSADDDHAEGLEALAA